MTDIKTYRNKFAENKEKTINELITFLKFPSISAQKEYFSDCLECADWLVRFLKNIGFKSEILQTASKPVVYGEYLIDPDKKTVLIYGHYDVQPAKKEDGWHEDPFNPIIKDNNIIARGAVDNKGQIFYIIKALETLVKDNSLEYNIKIIIEGEEETGSIELTKNIPIWKEKLKADTLLVCDSGMTIANTPTIEVGMRGIASFNVQLQGPKQDLHSGAFGGLVKNPAKELVCLLAKLFDENGSIAIPNFYDNVPDVTLEEKQQIKSCPFSEKELFDFTGLPATGGEINYSPQERNGLRPTIEINGIQSGYNGEGSKTIIPAVAKANISCRIARGQDGKKSIEQIKKFLIANAAKEMKLEFTYDEFGCDGFVLNTKSRMTEIASQIFKDLYNKDVVFKYHGATIPIIPTLIKDCTKDGLATGFSLESDGMHSPNECFGLDRFENGYVFICLLLSKN